jgi:hypothetical protein
MTDGAGKSKCTFRRILASEPISASELETAERLLARIVAVAYADEHRDLFTPGTDEPPSVNGGPTLSSSAVPWVE